MFENLIEHVKKQPIPEKHYIDMTESRLMNPNLLSDKIKDISLLEDNELLQLLIIDYPTILEEIVEKKNVVYINLFKKPRFLTIFTNAVSYNISRGKPLEPQNRIYINIIIYDYICHTEKDMMLKSLMANLSKIVNRDMIPMIMAIGIPEELACTISIARYSSRQEYINIKRVNLIILGSPLELMTEQMIVDLISVIYDKMPILFETIMFDHTIDNDNTEDEGELYSRISNAILTHLENMPLENISTVIKMYSNDYVLLHSNEDVRFSLRSINNTDFPRINQTVDSMIMKGEYIP